MLDGVSCDVVPGKTMAIVGPSGSGKSTTIALISRFYDVDKGRVLIDGVDIKTYDPQWLRMQIGLVSQEPVRPPARHHRTTAHSAPSLWGCRILLYGV